MASRRQHGLTVCGLEHRILLALRATGQLASDQVYERFGSPSSALHRLELAGLITKPPIGRKGEMVRITPAGRALVATDGPLARRKTEIVYCQL